MGKYEEALERARQGLPMEQVFPELKGSEDERIRKGLVHFILYEAGNLLDEETEHAFISWLEKQKEPLTPEERMNHPLYLEGFDARRQVGEAVSQPAEWSEEGGCSEKPNNLLSKPAIVWRRVDKSPDFTKLNLAAMETGVGFYKGLQKEGVAVGMRDGIITTNMNLSKVLGDSYYLTFEDLLAIPKENNEDQPAESDDESVIKLSRQEVGNILIREQSICKDALDTFGVEHQMDKCIEECAELINALEKYRRGRALSPDVVTEIADVMITCVQMSIVFSRVAVVHEEARKLKRLEKRIEKAKNKAKSGDKESVE